MKTTLLKTFRLLPATLLFLLALLGCQQKESPQELREKTAQATSEAKRDAQAVAQGVREGWNRDQAADRTVNLNTATKAQLLSLPGLTEAEADRVIAGRPYNDPDDVVNRRILSRAEYDKIAGRVTAK
jgi:DNA uptake protein ComE-like DNA-binding protein